MCNILFWSHTTDVCEEELKEIEVTDSLPLQWAVNLLLSDHWVLRTRSVQLQKTKTKKNERVCSLIRQCSFFFFLLMSKIVIQTQCIASQNLKYSKVGMDHFFIPLPPYCCNLKWSLKSIDNLATNMMIWLCHLKVRIYYKAQKKVKWVEEKNSLTEKRFYWNIFSRILLLQSHLFS